MDKILIISSMIDKLIVTEISPGCPARAVSTYGSAQIPEKVQDPTGLLF
jgi:hypothetical protein